MKPKVNIVMVGHIDHGKSTLIGRVLFDTKSIKPGKLKEIEQTVKNLEKDFEYAFVLDSLQEEREQGITIDTTQIPFETEKYRYNIIDAPGHREFIKNMLSGASYAESAVVLVSAKSDEGIQEQTRRHIFLLKLFGIKQVFIAVNKMDTVEYSQERFEEIKKRIQTFLDKLGYGQNLHFIPISAKMGENILQKSDKIDWYTGPTLIEILDVNLKPKENPIEKPVRIPIQYVQDLDGTKVVMGRIESGKLKAGDKLVFEPNKIETEVKEIKEKLEAIPGDNIGFTLTENRDIQRGQVAGSGDNPPKPVENFISEVFILGEKGINVRDNLEFRCGTSLTKGQIVKISKRTNSETGEILEDDAQKLFLDDVGILEVKLTEPMVVEKFEDIAELGRFMIENSGNILAAGIIHCES